MKTVVAAAIMLCAATFVLRGWAYGESTPAPVSTASLEQIGDWVDENPYSGNAAAIEIGDGAYAQHCARCHGPSAVGDGSTPDLRVLNDEFEWDNKSEYDKWYIQRVRYGAVVQGRVYMPPYERVLSQETMWAILAYLETRPYED